MALEPNMVPRSKTEAEAIAWFTRLNGAPSPADRRDFKSWIERDPAHAAVYAEIAETWSQADLGSASVDGDDAEKLETYLRAIERTRQDKRGNRIAPVGIVLLLLLLPAVWVWLNHPNFIQDLSADHATVAAERRLVTLSDGSEVLLDADSAISDILDGAERRVTLLRGSAYFRIRKSHTPFIVTARDGETRVFGTQFDVSLLEQGVVVTLAEGSVAVTAADHGRSLVLKPGERVRYDSKGLGSIETVAIGDAMAWHTGRYIFDNARLGDVLTEIGRYRGGRITVLGRALADRRVTGSFSLDDPNQALSSLQSSFGFRLTRLGGRLIVVGP